MWPFSRRQPAPVPLEEQLAVLASCGIRLRAGVPTESLLQAMPREAYESNPYRELLGELGDQDEERGQAFLIGCSTEPELRFLRERTGLEVDWLE